MTDRADDQTSLTAQESSGILGLGRSSGQRSAETLAGIRAELMPKPIVTLITLVVLHN